MTKIIFTESYVKREKKFLRLHPELNATYGKVLRLVELNINHPSLRLHKLKGKLQNLSSISINSAYRITIYFLIRESAIVPVDVGAHEEVY